MPTNDQLTEAEWLSAFGEPTRMAVIRLLSTGAKTVTNLAEAVGVEVVNISHHLNLMKSLGLVSVERDGRFMWYSLLGATASGTTLTMTHSSGVKVVIPLA